MDLPELPYVDCLLPSRGVLYGDKIPGGKVQIRKLTVGEDILIQTTAGGVELVTKLVATCTKLPNNFNAKDLLLPDRAAILIAIRTFTFGAKYDAPFTCQECGILNKHVVDLSTDITEKISKGPLTEPIDVLLKDAKARVGLRMLRGTDEEAIAKVSKRKALKSNDEDGSEIVRMALQIVTINDDATISQDDKEKFVRFLSIPDSQDFHDAIDSVEPGLDLVIRPECTGCGAVNERGLPFNGEFFRPARRSAR